MNDRLRFLVGEYLAKQGEEFAQVVAVYVDTDGIMDIETIDAIGNRKWFEVDDLTDLLEFLVEKRD